MCVCVCVCLCVQIQMTLIPVGQSSTASTHTMPTHRQQDKLIILMHLYEVSDKSAIRRCAIRVNENLGTRRRLTKEPRRHLHMKAR